MIQNLVLLTAVVFTGTDDLQKVKWQCAKSAVQNQTEESQQTSDFSLREKGAEIFREGCNFLKNKVYLLEFTASADDVSEVRIKTSFLWKDIKVEGPGHTYYCTISAGEDKLEEQLFIKHKAGGEVTLSDISLKEINRRILRTDGRPVDFGCITKGPYYYHNAFFDSPPGKVLADLYSATCSFPGNCAQFTSGQNLIFLHGHRNSNYAMSDGASVITIEGLKDGYTQVKVSVDNRIWHTVKEIRQDGTYILSVPEDLLPSMFTAFQICSPEKKGGSFRLTRYSFVNKAMKDYGYFRGNRYFIKNSDKNSGISFLSDKFKLSGLRPGWYERLTVFVNSKEKFRGRLEFKLVRTQPCPRKTISHSSSAFFLKPGETRKRSFSFVCSSAGQFTLNVQLIEKKQIKAETQILFYLPLFFNDETGVLWLRNRDTACWSCSSLLKPAMTRQPPEKKVSLNSKSDTAGSDSDVSHLNLSPGCR